MFGRRKKEKKDKKNMKFTARIEVVPTEGKSNTVSTEVKVSGASIREVLAAAGVSGDKRDLKVNGKPATLDTHIGPDDFVEVTAQNDGAPYRKQGEVQKQVAVQVAERPRGS